MFSFLTEAASCRFSASADVNKHVEGVIQSAKFPAAQPPDPNQPSKIETEYWPCPPSLAAMGNTHPQHTQHTNAAAPPSAYLQFKFKSPLNPWTKSRGLEKNTNPPVV